MRYGLRRNLRRAAVVIGLAAVAYLFASDYLGPASAAPTRIELRHAQEDLISLGFDIGTADGSLGPRTRLALKSFQTQFGLKPTGRLDLATLHALDIRSPPVQPAAPASPPESGDAAPGTAASDNSSSDGSGGGVILTIIVLGVVIWLVVRSQRSKSAGAMPVSRYRAVPSRENSSNKAAARGFQSALMPLQNMHTEIGVRPTADRAEQSRRCWVPASHPTIISGHSIPGGMLYVGSALTRQDGYGSENCLIVPSLEVSSTIANDSGVNVPYWPSYAALDPASRLSFLRWLENGKRDPAIYIGYVFIYFYGLERRLMLDDPGEEASAIIDEVNRLLSIYRDNHSFERYAVALLGAAAVKFNLPLEWPTPSMRKLTWQLPLNLQVCLGRAVANGSPLGADQMLSWYNSHSDKRLPTLAGRCPEEFHALFAARFAAKYPNGVKVEPPKRRLSASYRAASSTFNIVIQGAATTLPDVSGLSAPLNLLDPIVESCANDLAAYSRAIGKDRSSKNVVAAAASLPAQLLETAAGKPIAELKSWLIARIVGSAATMRLRDLVVRIGGETPTVGRISKPDLSRIAVVLARCGFGIEPDPRIAYSYPAFDDEVIVFVADTAMGFDEVRPVFLSALAHIDIGMLVAAADGVVAQAELQTLEQAIAGSQDLSLIERQRLNARLMYLAKNPPTARILARFKDRPLPDREAVARLAIAVAAADGGMAVEELRLLEKIYKALELPATRLYGDVQAYGAREEELREVAPAGGPGSIPIPLRPVPSDRPTAISLDANRLARTRADTAVVSSILGEIFREDDPPPESAAQTSQRSGDSSRSVGSDASLSFDGLDEKYVPLMATIALRDDIPRGEFEALAGEYNLLCDGSIEAINDWSYGRFGEPMLDDGSEIVVNRRLLGLLGRKAA